MRMWPLVALTIVVVAVSSGGCGRPAQEAASASAAASGDQVESATVYDDRDLLTRLADRGFSKVSDVSGDLLIEGESPGLSVQIIFTWKDGKKTMQELRTRSFYPEKKADCAALMEYILQDPGVTDRFPRSFVNEKGTTVQYKRLGGGTLLLFEYAVDAHMVTYTFTSDTFYTIPKAD